jgi:hypothetical protein
MPDLVILPTGTTFQEESELLNQLTQANINPYALAELCLEVRNRLQNDRIGALERPPTVLDALMDALYDNLNHRAFDSYSVMEQEKVIGLMLNFSFQLYTLIEDAFLRSFFTSDTLEAILLPERWLGYDLVVRLRGY